MLTLCVTCRGSCLSLHPALSFGMVFLFMTLLLASHLVLGSLDSRLVSSHPCSCVLSVFSSTAHHVHDLHPSSTPQLFITSLQRKALVLHVSRTHRSCWTFNVVQDPPTLTKICTILSSLLDLLLLVLGSASCAVSSSSL